MANNSSGCLGKLIEVAAIAGIVYSLCNYLKEDKPVQNPSFFKSFNNPIQQRENNYFPQNLWNSLRSNQSYTPSNQNRDYRKNPLTEQEIRNNAPVFHY